MRGWKFIDLSSGWVLWTYAADREAAKRTAAVHFQALWAVMRERDRASEE